MAEPVSTGVTDPEIRAERSYLVEARAALGRMHEDVVNTPTVRDSSEDADYTFTNRQLVRYRERRAESLVDFPEVPLFFGRLDYPRGTVFGTGSADRTVAESAHIAAAETRGLHRLYVALTRAVSRLHIVHGTALPEILDGVAQ